MEKIRFQTMKVQLQLEPNRKTLSEGENALLRSTLPLIHVDSGGAGLGQLTCGSHGWGPSLILVSMAGPGSRSMMRGACLIHLPLLAPVFFLLATSPIIDREEAGEGGTAPAMGRPAPATSGRDEASGRRGTECRSRLEQQWRRRGSGATATGGGRDGRRWPFSRDTVLEGLRQGMEVRGRVSGVWGSSWRGQGVEGWLGWLGFERRPEAAMAAMVDTKSSSSLFERLGGTGGEL